MRRDRNLFRSGAANVAGQVLYLLVLLAVGRHLVPEWSGVGRDAGLLVLVLVPSGIWTTFFYLQDRREPEPTFHVTASFLAGMAAAALVATPLLRRVFRIREWIYGSPAELVLGSTLVVGGVAAILFHLVLRYGFLPLREFDEPADGMAYGAFVGSGFAFVTSLHVLARDPASTLFAMGYTASTNILVYASVGALVGHFVAREKFAPGAGATNLALGILAGTVLLGAYHTANELVFLRGGENAFGLSVLLTLVYAVLVLGLAYGAMRRLTAGRPGAGATVGRAADPLPLALSALVLVAGGAVAARATADATFRDPAVGVELRHPADLSVPAFPDLDGSPVADRTLLAAALGIGGDATFTLTARRETAVPEELDPGSYIEPARPLTLVVGETSVGGRRGLRVRHSALRMPGRAGGEYPRLLWAITDVVPTPTHTVVFSVHSRPEAFDEARATYERILRSVVWTEAEEREAGEGAGGGVGGR